MSEETTLDIFRILNQSKTNVSFQTMQGAKIVITPGSIIDLYSFEIDQSPSFGKACQSGILKVSINQTSNFGKSYLEQIKDDIKIYRDSRSILIYEDEPDPDKNKKINPQKPKSKKPVQKSRKEGTLKKHKKKK